jgi:hypothetical protein
MKMIAPLAAALSLFAATPIYAQGKPDTTFLATIMDCRASLIGWCYGHSLIKVGTEYWAYFFAPTNAAYSTGTECIYVAKASSLTSTKWAVYSGTGWVLPPWNAYKGTPTQCKPVVCHDLPLAETTITDGGSAFVNAGWNSMQSQVHVGYTGGPPAAVQYYLNGSPVAAQSHFGTAYYPPANKQIYRVTFDYETNYDNSLVFGGLTAAGNVFAWTRDVWGYSNASADVALAPTPWIGFGLFSRAAFTPPENWLFRPRNIKLYSRSGATHVGDPAVFKIGSTFYMFYSYWESGYGYPGEIRVASSTDGLNWSGKTMLLGDNAHRPAVYNDGTTISLFYDMPHGTSGALKLERRQLAVSNVANIANPSAWTAPQFGTNRLYSGNVDVVKRGAQLFFVSDALSQYFYLGYNYSSDGLNFTPANVGAQFTDQNSVPTPDQGLSVGQLFQDGGDTYLIGSNMIPTGNPYPFAPDETQLLRLDFDWTHPQNAGTDFVNGGWSSMQAGQLAPTYSGSGATSMITYTLRQNASIAGNSHYGTLFAAPEGKTIYKVTFDYVGNYNNANAYGGMTIPGSAQFWVNNVYGNTSGSKSLEVPNAAWVGFGMFGASAFTVPVTNWLFQVKNLKIYYH